MQLASELFLSVAPSRPACVSHGRKILVSPHRLLYGWLPSSSNACRLPQAKVLVLKFELKAQVPANRMAEVAEEAAEERLQVVGEVEEAVEVEEGGGLMEEEVEAAEEMQAEVGLPMEEEEEAAELEVVVKAWKT